MTAIPPNLSVVSDDELAEWHRQLARIVAEGANVNAILANAPRLAAIQAEIQLRATRELHREITALHSAVGAFDTSSTAAASRIWRLTWLLVGLTAALLAVTIALIITSS